MQMSSRWIFAHFPFVVTVVLILGTAVSVRQTPPPVPELPPAEGPLWFNQRLAALVEGHPQRPTPKNN